MTGPQPPLNDPILIWQNQETEKTKMSIEEVRHKAQKFLAKTRFDNAIGFVFTLIAVIFCAVVLVEGRGAAPRVIAALVMTMMLVRVVRSLYFSYRKYGRIWHATTLGNDAALRTCLEFYRNELERQREMRREPAWQLAVTFLVIGWLARDAVLRSGAGLISIALPFVLFSAAAFILVLAVRKFEVRRLQAELDTLEKFEHEDS